MQLITRASRVEVVEHRRDPLSVAIQYWLLVICNHTYVNHDRSTAAINRFFFLSQNLSYSHIV